MMYEGHQESSLVTARWKVRVEDADVGTLIDCWPARLNGSTLNANVLLMILVNLPFRYLLFSLTLEFIESSAIYFFMISLVCYIS